MLSCKACCWLMRRQPGSRAGLWERPLWDTPPLLTAVRLLLSQAMLPLVEAKPFCGPCPALVLMPGLPPQMRCSIPPSAAWPLLRLSAETPRSPVCLAPSISANSALQPQMDGEPGPAAAEVCGLRKERRSLSDAAPHQPAVPSHRCSPREGSAKGCQRQSDGSASGFGLCGEKPSRCLQNYKSSFAVCQWCKSLPCSPTHQPGLGGATLLPGLG